MITSLMLRYAAAALLVAVLLGGIYRAGVTHERERWEAKEAKRDAGIAAEWVKAGQDAAASARTIYDHLSIARQYAGATVATAPHVIREVRYEIRNAPALLVPVPPGVRRVRDDAVAQSAAIADRARRSAGERPGAVQATGR